MTRGPWVLDSRIAALFDECVSMAHPAGLDFDENFVCFRLRDFLGN
jgi:hypothetical protein